MPHGAEKAREEAPVPTSAVTQAAFLVPLKSASVGGHPLSHGMARGAGTAPQSPRHSLQLCPEALNACLRFSGFKQNKNLIHCFQSYRKLKSFIFLPLKKKKKEKKSDLYVLEEF